MTTIYDVKLNLNGKELYFSDKKDKPIEIVLFEELAELGRIFSINDDGSKYEAELKEFDISKDKEIGNIWDFKVNKDSIPILKETIRQYSDWGYLQWKLKGDDFFIDYEEWSDESHQEFKETGPSGKETVIKIINIKATKEVLQKIYLIIDKYEKFN